jgi:hypothetical protein
MLPPLDSRERVMIMDADLITTATLLPSPGPRTSGEVEPVLVRAGGVWFFAVGSDHTDRELEAISVKDSKAVCPKPVSRTAIRLALDPVGGGLDAAWDGIEITSAIDDVAYRHGSLAALRVPSDLIARATRENPSGDLVIFCGTVPLMEGEFRYGERFSTTMSLPGVTLRLEYALSGAEL